MSRYDAFFKEPIDKRAMKKDWVVLASTEKKEIDLQDNLFLKYLLF